MSELYENISKLNLEGRMASVFLGLGRAAGLVEGTYITSAAAIREENPNASLVGLRVQMMMILEGTARIADQAFENEKLTNDEYDAVGALLDNVLNHILEYDGE